MIARPVCCSPLVDGRRQKRLQLWSSHVGHAVTFTDTVSDTNPPHPHGHGVLLAEEKYEQALLTLSSLSLGSHRITATYSGDANFTSPTATFTETAYP